MTSFHRRHLLKSLARTLSVGAMARLATLNSLAAITSSDYKALVFVFLLGGNDHNNTIIPITTTGGDAGDQSFADYAAVRPSSGIGLAESALLPINVNKDVYGLHPSLQNIAKLYASGNVALLANVGNLVQPTTTALYQEHIAANDGALPLSLESHNDQQEQWATGFPNDFSTTGWGGRTADVFAKTAAPPFPMNVQASGGSLFSFGSSTAPASVVGFDPNASFGYLQSDGIAQLLGFSNGVQLVQASNALTAQGIYEGGLLAEAILGLSPTILQALQNRFLGLSSALSAQLLTVAKVIAVSAQLGVTRQIFYVSQGGYDTHGGEPGIQAGLLADLDSSLNAFYLSSVDLGAARQVTTFTNSEFGRTFTPNSNLGTDHAWGGHHFIVGGAVNGGQMYGTFPTLRVGGPNDISNVPGQTRGVIIPTTSIAEYGATLARWFGVNTSNGDLVTVFPNLNNFPAFNPSMGLGFI